MPKNRSTEQKTKDFSPNNATIKPETKTLPKTKVETLLNVNVKRDQQSALSQNRTVGPEQIG